MKSPRNKSFSFLLVLLLAGAALPVLADDGCLDFKWDVGKERSLFAGRPAALTAGKDSSSAPVVVPNRLYTLRLLAQDRVAFSAAPGKEAAPSAYAGLAALKIPSAGSYRVAIDLPFWIDVVSHGRLLRAADFQGQHGCNAPHKIVEFDLAGTQPFILQFSDATVDSVLFTVTPSPARKL